MNAFLKAYWASRQTFTGPRSRATIFTFAKTARQWRRSLHVAETVYVLEQRVHWSRILLSVLHVLGELDVLLGLLEHGSRVQVEVPEVGVLGCGLGGVEVCRREARRRGREHAAGDLRGAGAVGQRGQRARRRPAGPATLEPGRGHTRLHGALQHRRGRVAHEMVHRADRLRTQADAHAARHAGSGLGQVHRVREHLQPAGPTSAVQALHCWLLRWCAATRRCGGAASVSLFTGCTRGRSRARRAAGPRHGRARAVQTRGQHGRPLGFRRRHWLLRSLRRTGHLRHCTDLHFYAHCYAPRPMATLRRVLRRGTD